ncbi:bacillithiol biosynthesis deacetylase BshB1 [bacterium]|nr:bacillithiol biosynthesis deacetylase BshB1 [bacterium]
MEASQLDVLAFAPHPDDAELHCAGTLLLLSQAGRRVGIIDLTRGELSTRGTVDSRAAETAEATRILGLDLRENLDLPDGGLANIPEQRMAVIRALRQWRPATVMLPYFEDRHPDHMHASELVRDAVFASGLAKLKSSDTAGRAQLPWRPARAYYYMLSHDFTPAFIIDISAVFEQKMQAVRAYASQFYTGENEDGPETYISTPEFLDSLIGRAQRLGFHVGGKYGEGFLPLQPQRFEAEWLLS